MLYVQINNHLTAIFIECIDCVVTKIFKNLLI